MKLTVIQESVIGKRIDCHSAPRGKGVAQISVVSNICKLRLARSAIPLHACAKALYGFADVHDSVVNNKSVQDVLILRTLEKLRHKLVFRGDPFTALNEAHRC